LVAEGNIRQLGVTNFAAWQIGEVVRVAERVGAPRPIDAQQHYNLLARRNRFPWKPPHANLRKSGRLDLLQHGTAAFDSSFDRHQDVRVLPLELRDGSFENHFARRVVRRCAVVAECRGRR
jgi:hypothetical protein